MYVIHSLHKVYATLTMFQIYRKPIYDDAPDHLPPNPSLPAKSTPTDRLAEQIRRARLHLHDYAASLEDRTNDLLSQAFNLEHSFTNTIASLAPPKSSNERLMPGAIYVLIAAMGSSILVRNRNFLVRWTVPFAVGIGTAWAIIPITTRNVGDLIWKYEERFPVVADTHTRVRDGVTNFVQTGIAHSKMGVAMLEEKVGDVRKSAEDWIRKGK
jgi:organizing structure protein 2